MKNVHLDAEFAELRGNNRAVGRGTASTTKAAISRAFADLFKQPNVKHKRVSHINVTVYINDATEITKSEF